MKRRKWTNEQKLMIVLSDLKGLSIGKICNEHGISQNQYYKWHDQFLSNASKAFDTNKPSNKQLMLEAENRKLKGMIGQLHFELKKQRSGYETC